jgi:DNA-directed RNA polymerase subunit RPC12/RpoP
MARRTEKLSNAEYCERIFSLYNEKISVLEPYVNQRTKILHRCNLHNFEWKANTRQMMDGHNGCTYCRREKFSESMKDTLDSLKEKIFYKYGNEYEVLSDKYIDHKHKMLFRHNLKDGSSHTLISLPGRILTENSGCPVCSGMQISKGYNDIATIDPEIASWFLNEEETFIYGKCSNVKVDFKCPDCGHIVHKLINQVSKDRDVRCPICKDGISYPNKFIFNSMLQIEDKLDFLEREFRPEWCVFTYKYKLRRGIYDIYFGINGNKYIIEMDGGFHGKDNNLSGQSAEDSKYIDKEKDRLAIENNIKIIRIDCDYGFNDKFDYVKNNILCSDLNNILPLNLIDFVYANVKSQKSLLFETCNLWNNGYKASEIINELNIPECSVSTYLKTGQKYGLCGDYSARNSYIRSQGRKVVCLNTNETFDTVKDAERYYKVDGVGNCCDGKTYSAGKHKISHERLFWLYYEDYIKMSENDVLEYIENKYKIANDTNIFGRKVICLTTDKIFVSVMDASRFYKVVETGIRKCCKGDINTSGKLEDGTRLKWMYYDDYIKLNSDIECGNRMNTVAFFME